ncbi:hypothetical protein ACMHYO_11575 [Allopusillimonas ginsengisoli]|uniref:hypothetical protein n=1 Tax=Allopusillimonas ginsengisoli TaxID=453575 RepID=UPI0039C0E588
MLMTQEHYALMSAFERCHSGRFDREDKSLWPKGVIYQDGRVNELFLAYRNGYAYSQADTRSDIQNLEASRDGYRRDVGALRDALLGLLDALPSATTHPAIKRAKDALLETCHG